MTGKRRIKLSKSAREALEPLLRAGYPRDRLEALVTAALHEQQMMLGEAEGEITLKPKLDKAMTEWQRRQSAWDNTLGPDTDHSVAFERELDCVLRPVLDDREVRARVLRRICNWLSERVDRPFDEMGEVWERYKPVKGSQTIPGASNSRFKLNLLVVETVGWLLDLASSHPERLPRSHLKKPNTTRKPRPFPIVAELLNGVGLMKLDWREDKARYGRGAIPEYSRVHVELIWNHWSERRAELIEQRGGTSRETS